MLFVIGLVIFGIVIFTFSSKYSIIPFFPSNPTDLPHIIDALDLQNDQIIVDMGAGTGTVIFEAAQIANEKNLNTTFVAIDINFFLTAIMQVKRLFHPHKNHIQIVTADIFTYDYKLLTTSYKLIYYYMYVSPSLTDNLMNLVKKTKQKSKIVAYYYPVKSIKEIKRIKGLHEVFVYAV